MAESRKPTIVVMLKKRSKKTGKWGANKVELFPAKLWGVNDCVASLTNSRFRLRINGKWWPEGGKVETFTLTNFSQMFRKSLLQAARR